MTDSVVVFEKFLIIFRTCAAVLTVLTLGVLTHHGNFLNESI